MLMPRNDLIESTYEQALKFARQTPYPKYEQRIETLEKLKQVIIRNKNEINTALFNDLGKSEYESQISEMTFVIDEIDVHLKNLKKWMSPRKVKTPLVLQPGSSQITPEPFGLVLIIGPWNYPLNLIATPLIGSIAAGNITILKPSELAPHTSKILVKISKELNSPFLHALEGGVGETTQLLEKKFDHIFFTGSPRVGKIIMSAAAKHLTPVTLELGGKSPTVIWGDQDLDIVASRIIWGKLINTGQTCVAPDYLIVQEKLKKELIEKLKNKITEFYGNDPINSPDYGKIINENNFNRLISLIEKDKVLLGGESIKEKLKIAPTLVESDLDSPIMKEEIFGPILPIISIKELSEIDHIIALNPRPLVMYLFTLDQSLVDYTEKNFKAGALCVNDTIIQISNFHLPFGGIGNSGMGSYHGIHSFDNFSHFKPVIKRKQMLDLTLRYPPYEGKLKPTLKLLKWFGH